jgi:LacI family transcriptional regulator
MTKTHKPVRASTIVDVAAEAKVSKSTVSLVLQGSKLIRPATTARVHAAARKLGYVYNRRAAELRHRASNTIGVIINDLMNPLFAEMLVGLERKLVDAGYIALLAHTNEDLERQEKVLLTMREQNAAGIALCPAIGTPGSLPRTIKSWGIPLVVMVRLLDTDGYDFSGSDNTLGVKQATAHLIAKGHRRIGFLAGLPGRMLEMRLLGYRTALAEAGIKFDDRLVIKAAPTRTGGYETLNVLLARRPAVTAAVCYNDLVAFGALSELGNRGLHAGTDFDLMGFDNLIDAAIANPPLSTVDVHPSEMGEHAASILLARIANPGRALERYFVSPNLILRQSG